MVGNYTEDLGKAEIILGTLLGSAEVNKTETHTEGKVRETLEGHVERKAERILEVSAGAKGAVQAVDSCSGEDGEEALL